MLMEYKKEDIEFAYRLLNDRESLEDSLVEEWMKVPLNLRLLNDMEVVRERLSETEGESETEQLERLMYERRSRKMTLYWSVAIAGLLALALLISRLIRDVQV